MLIVGCLAVCAMFVPATAQDVDRPNILWITVEDISPDLGCYGDEYAVTPRLDRLAREGVRYLNAFGHAGVCAVNRTGIITCMYPTTIGTQHMRCKGVPPAYVKCFTEYLRAAGYYCTNNVKTDYNFDAPVTAWDENSRTADWRGREPGQPFFSVINLTTTHESQIRLPAEKFAQRNAELTAEERHDPNKAVLPPYYPDTPVVRHDWANYYDLITVMDHQVGEILDRLDSDGLADETIVFYYSDHGRGLPRAKRWLYDSGMQIPLIIRWPDKHAAGEVNDELVAMIDFGPTVLSLAGVPIPDYMQGQAFLGDQKAPPREYIYGARDRMDETYDIIRAVRDKRFKYLRNYEPEKTYAQPIAYMDQMPTMQELRRLNAEGRLDPIQALFFRPTKPREELFDTVNDPHEVNDLAGSPEYADVLERMRAVHERWREETGDLGLIPEAELWEQRRPGGVYAVTASPEISPAGGEHDQPVSVTISCATEGASIAYTTEKGKKPHWKLYAGPVTLEQDAVMRCKACRLGYRDSEEVRAAFTVKEAGGQ